MGILVRKRPLLLAIGTLVVALLFCPVIIAFAQPQVGSPLPDFKLPLPELSLIHI